VGVPFGGINESAIVGDLEIQYRVNEDGTLNLRLFIGRMILIILDKIVYPRNGVTYEVDFDTFKEVNKIFTNHKIGLEPTYTEYQDSNLAPEYINFLSPRLLKLKCPRKN
jgi:hypothetical protein